jgi:alpha-glucuronidase
MLWKLSPIILLAATATLQAESGAAAWLRYTGLSDAAVRQYRAATPGVVSVYGSSPMLESAREELIRGVRGLLGRTLRLEARAGRESAFVIGTLADIKSGIPGLTLAGTLEPDAFAITTARANGVAYTVIAGGTDRGALYGVFAYLRKLSLGEPVAELNDRQAPYAPIRWVNQWDNLDGSIERGYGGRSVFWDGGKVRDDLSRVNEYGRLLASLGINGIDITNVNSNPKLLGQDFVPQIARVADVFRKWGVRVAISVDFGSPQSLGGLSTYDPLDGKVAEFWKTRVDALYQAIPDMGGFVLKADSEGRVGPSTYGRTHADAANVVARALKPHGGVLFYRGFVYDHHMDWQNPKNDRGRAAWDNFKPLDGAFDDNVIVQIKNGPIDFQVREPASPLFGALEKTNQAIELQVTQEYMGQAKHLVYLVPMWKEVLDFDMLSPAAGNPVKALVAGKSFKRPTGGFVAVVNVGLDENWLGNQMSQANLYGYGRLAWNPDLSAQRITDEWTKQTFGFDPKVAQTVNSIQLSSWRTYENYTGPLGLQTLTDIVGDHYGVAVEASERNGWGQWHKADETGIGMDRTVATGTGYVGQYKPGIAKIYESKETCPDDLLLFLHHVPYTYKLHSGKTVVQHIYDSHYEGAEAVARYAREWKALKGLVDEPRYKEILAQLDYQTGQAQVWRDAVNGWFLKASNVPDAKGRAGKFPNRTEAEAMKLTGYTAQDITPWEGASGGKAVGCAAGTAACTAAMQYNGAAGWFALHVQYFDQPTGVSRYRAYVGKQLVDEWAASEPRVPARKMDSSASTRRLIPGIALRPGDEIRIEGTPDGRETAGLDYIEILPDAN